MGSEMCIRDRPGATFNATCSMENGVKELSIKEEIESSEKEKTA